MTFDVDAIKRDPGLLLARFEKPRQFGRQWRARCPLHGGERLSVTIRSGHDGWVFHCHACGEHGDVINFVQAADKVSFREACARLSNAEKPLVPLWTPPPPKKWVVPCEAKGCGERLELDDADLAVVDVGYPSWRFDRSKGIRALCPRCSLRLAQAQRREPERRAA